MKRIPLSLKEVQAILYDIIYMVDDFCKKHNIEYFLVGGTLLGAVRHQGIIPWDDDADIAMTRENYERFIELFHAEGVEGYELFDHKHKDNYIYPFAKMARVDTWISTWPIYKINIDIFAYDGCGDDLASAQEYFLKNRENVSQFLRTYFFRHDFSKLNWKGILVYLLLCFPREILHFPFWILYQDKKSYLSKKFSQYAGNMNIKETKYCANVVWGTYGKGEVQQSSSFLILDKMRFGTRELPVPSGWHDYLTGIYGDYLTLPPEEKRRKHITDTPYRIENK